MENMVRNVAPGTRTESEQQRAPYPLTPTSPRQSQSQQQLIPDGSNLPSSGLESTYAGDSITTSNPLPSGIPGKEHGNHDRSHEQEVPSLLRPGGGRQHLGPRSKDPAAFVPHDGSAEVTPRSSWESQRSLETQDTLPTHILDPPTQGASSVASSNNPFHRHRQLSSGKQETGGLDNSSTSHSNHLELEQTVNSSGHAHPSIADPFTAPWMTFREPAAAGAKVAVQEHQDLDRSQIRSDILPQPLDNITSHAAALSPSQDVWSMPAHEPGHTISELHDNSSNAQGSDSNSALIASNKLEIKSYGSHVGYIAPASSDLLQDEATGPALPPRPPQTSEENPPQQPPRPSVNLPENPPSQPPRPLTTNEPDAKSKVEWQNQRDESAKAKRARETYQIRHVNWYDAASPSNLRRSPIMVQNANGPCPLLALVNALVLSTPAGYATALVETLRVREQVSLGLLLDAVIDELIGRNGDLPDVTDMYAFLVTLHTGMNVNPIFIPSEAIPNLMDASIEEDVTKSVYGSRQAGGFEDTREMKLYRTFAIPLIHGWIPPRNHPASAALKRTARTYEDAQNLMFREEELENKLQRQGLSPEEQITLEDVGSVKYFLSSTATQLTGYGLDTITEIMAPGSVSILFRNDHFSTLYRHPKSGQLLTLVTDMGYAGHDEVVWESLVDVSGEGCEFFSGDFRPVGNAGGEKDPSQPQHDGGWTTVPTKSRRSGPSNQRRPNDSDIPISNLNLNDDISDSKSPNTEQEDHDLALAMQLQEEEEERDRQNAAARRREDELSQNYLNNSDSQGRRTFPGFGRGAMGARGGPSPPPRGRGSGRGTTNSSRAPPPRKQIETEDAPPPTYEQAAKGPAYHPPAHHPAHPSAPPGAASSSERPLPGRPRHSSAYSEHAASYTGSSPTGPPRRGQISRPPGSGAIRGGGGVDPGLVRRRTGPSPSAISLEQDRRDKECIIM